MSYRFPSPVLPGSGSKGLSQRIRTPSVSRFYVLTLGNAIAFWSVSVRACFHPIHEPAGLLQTTGFPQFSTADAPPKVHRKHFVNGSKPGIFRKRPFQERVVQDSDSIPSAQQSALLCALISNKAIEPQAGQWAVRMQTQKIRSLSFDVCRSSRVARDVRYDGIFFSGAVTSKIYCRPICPVKPPLASNHIFFESRAQAEAAGFRPCLRCRPELAPERPIQPSASWAVRNLLGRIHQGLFPGRNSGGQALSIKEKAGQGQNDFDIFVGATPSRCWRTFQLGFAKMLLTDTALSPEEIAAGTRFENAPGCWMHCPLFTGVTRFASEIPWPFKLGPA